MASFRSVGVLAAAATRPLAVAPLGGVAQADNGDAGGVGSNASVAAIAGNGVSGADFGDSSTAQHGAGGRGVSNQSRTAGSRVLGFTVSDRGNVTGNHSPLW